MKVKFNLRNPKSKEETPLNTVIRWNNQKTTYSTGINLLPKDWNNENQSVRKSNDTSSELNSKLAHLTTRIRKHFLDCQSTLKHIPNSREFKKYLTDHETKKIAPVEERLKVTTLLQALDKKIEIESKRLKVEGKAVDRNSVAYAYKRLQTILSEFKEKTGANLLLDEIDINWYYDFKDYLKKLNYSPNYQAKLVKNIKAAFNLANEQNWTTNQVHKHKRFSKKEVKTIATYLNEQEIEKLLAHDFSDHKTHDNVRDLFVLACRTALRVSDLKRIQKDHIYTATIPVTFDNGDTKEIEQTFIKIQTWKSDKLVHIPMHSNVQQILEKHDYDLPSISNGKFNEIIKVVCRIAGLDKPIKKETRKGNLTAFKTVPQYELCASHTGRRSFATNHYKAGYPMLSIMQITGHSKVKDFKNYVVIENNEHAQIMAAHYYRLEQEKSHSKMKVV